MPLLVPFARALPTLLAYAGAALAEIGGCFAVWMWLRLGRSALWLLPGLASLGLFAVLLTLSESQAAGRAFAAYGGIYVLASIGWLWLVERTVPTRYDLAGATLCLIGTLVILAGRHRP